MNSDGDRILYGDSLTSSLSALVPIIILDIRRRHIRKMSTSVDRKLTTIILVLTLASSVGFMASSIWTLTPTKSVKRRKTLGKIRMMKSLPSNVVKCSQVPKIGTFTPSKIPKGLLREHTTKAGTWGVIKIFKGKLRYTINEPSPAEYILDKDTRGIIEPQVKHEVAALTDDLEFVVEFYRIPGTGPVVEKREGL